MEKVLYVKNDNLDEVLAKGGKVKMISTVAESLAGRGQSACSSVK